MDERVCLMFWHSTILSPNGICDWNHCLVERSNFQANPIWRHLVKRFYLKFVRSPIIVVSMKSSSPTPDAVKLRHHSFSYSYSFLILILFSLNLFMCFSTKNLKLTVISEENSFPKVIVLRFIHLNVMKMLLFIYFVNEKFFFSWTSSMKSMSV